MAKLRVPMLDLATQHQSLRDEVLAAWREVLDSGRFVLGPCAEAFERECARYLGVRDAIGCGSGTDALHLSLRALGIGIGDEVITTPFTFAATAEAIVHAGARPVFVDIDPSTYTLDPNQVADALTPDTRAILPVHVFGQAAAMEPLQALAREHDLALIEDAAQAFGARRGSRQVGSIGTAGCFSFFPSKNFGGCGDGGLVATDSPELAARLRLLRNHGAPRRNEHHEVGYTSRLDELQAAWLRLKLRRIDADNAARRSIALRYRSGLQQCAGVIVPVEDPAGVHIYHQYTILVRDRDRLARELAAAGIDSALYYPRPMHRQPAFSGCRRTTLRVADDVAARCLSLPIHPGLANWQVELVVDVVHRSLATRRAPTPC